MVLASFQSPTLVPRDVVFSHYSELGAVKESWTAPCYILSADFAEVVPADEDPMPLDGNPHPLPGNMFDNENLFVAPQYPELGWNENHLNHQNNHQNNVQPPNDNDNDMQQVQEQEEILQEENSIVLNQADSSDEVNGPIL